MWFALLLLFLSAGSHSESGTYPIDPISLRGLIDGSDLIVLGTAGETTEVLPWPDSENPTHGHWCQVSEVELDVHEVVHGEWRKHKLTPLFDSGMACPRSAEFNKGTTYLVFLAETHGERAPPSLRHRVIGLAYGAVTMTDERAVAYVKAIHAKLKIDQMEDMEQRQTATLNWIVDLAVSPHTRYDGAIELNEKRYLATGHSREFWTYGFSQTSLEQRHRLVDALAESKVIGRFENELLDAIGDWKDERLFDVYVRAAQQAKGLFSPAGVWIRRAMAYRSSDELEKFFQENWRHQPERHMKWCFNGCRKEELVARKEALRLLREADPVDTAEQNQSAEKKL